MKKRGLTTGLILLFIMSSFTLFAYNQKDYKKLFETGNCVGCDLSSTDLSGADFTGADLRNSNLSRANLKGTNFTRANLEGANLRNANMRGTKLYQTIWIDGKRCARNSISRCRNKRSR